MMTRSSPNLDITKYEQDGCLILRDVFTGEFTEELGRGWSEVKQELLLPTGRLQRRDRFVSGILPDPLGSVFRHPALAAVATQILGEDVALYMNRLLVKDAVWKGAVEVHQDMPFFHGSSNKLSVFVPLLPFNEETGGLTLVVGSHKYGNLGIRGAIALEKWPPSPTITPDLLPGDILLMNFFLWHYSEAPKAPSERPLLQIVYQPADDGSYFNDGLEGPTLVSGQWRTEQFVPFGFGIVPYAPAPPPTPASPSPAVAHAPEEPRSLLSGWLKGFRRKG